MPDETAMSFDSLENHCQYLRTHENDCTEFDISVLESLARRGKQQAARIVKLEGLLREAPVEWETDLESESWCKLRDAALAEPGA